MKVILLGPPGAGKGTQAANIADSLGVPRVSSGELFRDHQRDDTELGRLARPFMDRGDYVPDDVTIRMVMDWIDQHADAGGFVLDGFPRTFAQAEALDRAMADKGGIDQALYINVARPELIRRLTGRLLCRSCQTPYHAESAPPDQEGVCDKCGGELYQREDDRPEAVDKRIEVFLQETEPLIEYFRGTGILEEVSGEGPIEAVGHALLAALEGSDGP